MGGGGNLQLPVGTASSRERRREAWNSTVAVVAVAALAKALVLVFAYFLLDTPPHFLRELALRWDGGLYHGIAIHGYDEGPGIEGSWAFAPVFPLLWRFLGGAWWMGLVVANAAALGAIAVVARLMGPRPAMFLAFFPTWLAYSSMAYTESLFALVGALALLAHKNSKLGVSVFGGMAGLVRYAGFVPLAFWAVFQWRPRSLATYALPVGIAVAGLGVAVWHWHATGTPFAFFRAEQRWGATLDWPFRGLGWPATGSAWFGWRSIESWLRNLAFLVLACYGTALLWTDRATRFLAVFSAGAIVIAVCSTGLAVFSMPRHLLAAFPALAAIGGRFVAQTTWYAYMGLGFLGGAWIVTSQLRGMWG